MESYIFLALLVAIPFAARVTVEGTLSPDSRYLNWLKKGSGHFKYPYVRRNESVIDDYFGTKVSDPYRWLESTDSPETTKFINEQNNLTLPYVEGASGRDIMQRTLESLEKYTKYSLPGQRANRYFYSSRDGLQDQDVFYYHDELYGEPKLILDVNALDKAGKTSMQIGTASPNGEIVAIGLTHNGSDWVHIQFMNVTTGKYFPEILKHSQSEGVEWTKDSAGVFYSRYPEQNVADGTETEELSNEKVYYHKVGTPQSQDAIVVEFPDHPLWRPYAVPSDNNEYIVVSVSDGINIAKTFYGKIDKFFSSGYKIKPKLKPLIGNFDTKDTYLASNGDIFYFLTDKNAPNYRIVGVNVKSPDEKNWITVLPESKIKVITFVRPINNNQMVVVYTSDVKSKLELRMLTDGTLVKEFKLEPGMITAVNGRRPHNQFFYGHTSYLHPQTIYQVDLTKPNPEPKVYRESNPERYNPSEFVSKQVFYSSKDGTKIPMYITSKKGMKQNSKNPTLLYGYGGFGDIEEQPNFSPRYLAFIKLFGGVVAVANIRGGGEYGTKWHDAGRLLNKQNTFDDFQRAAEYLIGQKYTTSSRLTILGASNGGLLVGACVNQRPELFGAAIAKVGIMDMLRFQKFPIGASSVDEYGSSDNKTQFQYLYNYSPLHNIRMPKDSKVQYPAVLAPVGDIDDLEDPVHSYKYIAELQHTIGENKNQKYPFMILILKNFGHGGSAWSLKQSIREDVDIFSFISRSLKLKLKK